FLKRTARKHEARIVLTAHTMDDQAETVLMRLMRGSAAEGLSGMEAVSALEGNRAVLLVRPLLSWARRADTERYCRERGVEFRVDEMNMDENFTRVRVRKNLLPLMQQFNPRVVETISRTASLLAEDASALNASAAELLQRASEEGERSSKLPRLRVQILRDAPVAVRRRALRQWIAEGRGHLRRLELVHLLAVDGLLEGERGGRVIVLPGGVRISRRKNRLELFKEKG
ncbi:MAG TPA: tRNA lysidine(34) synthetase TilS, partial [Pyrinomonadaceae bacterium]|nr:tRNA lysidine(34) synthetase TilS [Pyrinomonadaceae bacterium]